MRAVTVITARLGSSRLPRKMLADLGGATVLERLVKRVAKAKRPDVVVLATTQEPEDDELDQRRRRHSGCPCSGAPRMMCSCAGATLPRPTARICWSTATAMTCSATRCTSTAIIETYEQTGAEYIVCAGLPFGAAPTGIARAASHGCASESSRTTPRDRAGSSPFRGSCPKPRSPHRRSWATRRRG